MTAPRGPALLPLPAERTEVYPDRDAWLTARRSREHRIGASIVGRILTRPWEALERLTGEAPEHDAETRRRLERGQRWERVVLEELSATRGVPVLPVGEAIGAPGSLVIVRHPTEDWLCASPDAGTLDPDAGPGLVEAKTDAGGRGWADVDLELRTVDDYTPDLCPSDYLTQSYVQLATTGLPFVDLVVLLPRYELRVVRVWADHDAQRSIVDAVGEWRERHLVRGEPLPVDASEACTRGLTRRYPGLAGDRALRPASPEEALLVRDYARLGEVIDGAEQDRREIRNRLAESVGDAYGLSLGGGAKFLLIPTRGRETVSLSDVRDQHPDLYRELVARGLVKRAGDYRQARTYGF